MKVHTISRLCALAAVLALSIPGSALADGDGILDTPSIAIAEGTGIAVGGVGMFTQPGMLTVDVPMDATVEQVLLYWAGRGIPDGTVIVELMEVTGTQIGVENADPQSTAFRADITSLNLISPGPNTLQVEDLNFTRKNDGIGILVITSGTAETAEIEIRDGLDFAYIFGPNPDNFDTIPQTFTFDPVAFERTGTLNIFVGDGTEPRADEFQVTVGGGMPQILCDEARGRDGNEWDTAEIPVTIPAGESSVTIQLFSRETNCSGGGNPDSLSWAVGALEIPVREPFCGDSILDPGENCDPPGSTPDPNFPNNICRDDCTYCGDGELNGDEECDFNQPGTSEHCTDACVMEPFCGDGNVDPGETCDPPGSIPDPNFPDNVCHEDCTYCGDGIVNGDEECDFNDPNAPDNCSDTCEVDPFCGDGNLDAGESCDPPGSIPDLNFPDNVCREDCTYCGDGEVNHDEVCDFNAPDAPPFCTTTCVLDEPLACRFTGGGVDTDGNWDHTLEDGEMIRNGAGHLPAGVDRYQFGGQAGANTALPPQPAGEWTHHQQRGPSGRFTFHGGTSSAPEGTEIDAIRCSDPDNCNPARNAPAKQLDFDGVGTFKSIGNGGNAPVWAFAGANVTEEGNGNHEFDGTYHWFEVNVDDLGERGGLNTGAPNSATCPSIGFGEKGAVPLANCDCPDFYRIVIYDGVDKATLESFGPNKTDVIYEAYGYIDGGNLQIHPLTGFDN